MTTPESFDSLLCRGRISGPEGHILSGARAVVLDEIHALANSPRGEQLRWLVERLRKLRTQSRERGWANNAEVQVLALSATIPDTSLVSGRFLRDGVVVDIPGGREILCVGGSQITPVEKALPNYINSSQEELKVLVFSGSRRRVDTLATALQKTLGALNYKVMAHHGSLSRGIRDEAEESARIVARSVFCATSTLEIGIDIGDIDLVVLDGPAPDMASFFQRIGRGNRRTNQTRVMLCADTPRDETIQRAMLSMAEHGWVGEPMTNAFYGVARQQVASYIFQAPQQVRSRGKLLDLLSPMVGSDTGNLLLDHMINTGDINFCREGFTLGDAWVDKSTKGQIHSNIEAAYGAAVIEENTGAEIATGVLYRGGSQIELAGHQLQVCSWDGSTLAVTKARGNQLPTGELSYVTAGKPPVDGQAYALRKHLGLDGRIWPVIQQSGKDFVFHLGGKRRLALLQYVANSRGFSLSGNEFWITAQESLTPKPSAFSNFSLSGLGPYVDSLLPVLEKSLNRPIANQGLPIELRVREVVELLGDEGEASSIKASVWGVAIAAKAHKALSALITSE